MTTDKFEIHYRQQLSALIDGELSADETRFLMRRLEHDEELSGCHERWHLLGDVLRGAACAPAPLDFSARVRAAVAAEPAPAAAAPGRARSGWRWGGGAAIAASVAALALFMTRERLPGDTVATPEPMAVVATTAQLPAAPAPAEPGATLADAAAAVPAAALAAARRQDAAAARRGGSATRTQQVARGVAARQPSPERRLASAQAAPSAAEALPSAANPFAHPSTLQARPWPRSVIAGDSALNASFARPPSNAAFYPFEPRLPAPPVLAGSSELPQPQP